MLKLFPYQRKLVNQTRDALIQKNKGVLIVSPPGSGKSVVISEIARLTTKKNNRVLFFVHRQELVKQIKSSFKEQNVNLNLCTIMTVGKVSNRLNEIPKPNLIIVDESQHSRAKTYLKIFDFFKDVPKLGFTGTPWRLSGKGFKDIYSKMIEGPSVKWLINNQKLAPFTLYGYPLGNDNLLKKGSTGDYTHQSMDVFSKSIIRGDIVKSWEQFANNKKTIVYCHSTLFSKEVAKAFNDAGIKAAHADAKTPKIQREKIMSDFKEGKIKILCNVDLVSEGFNVPDCSCVVLLRPTQSLVVYLQQAMRAMRYQPNKQAIIIDQVNNFSRFGLPDQQREWTLNDREKHTFSEKSEEIAIKTCPQCFAVILASKIKCPLCNFSFEAELRKIEEDRQAKLKAIKDEEKRVKEIADKKPQELKSIEELYIYAKEHNYKTGWAYYRAKQQGWLK